MVWEFIAGLSIGGAGGYFIANHIAHKNVDISQKSVLLQSLTTQVTEMKAKFDSVEKSRALIDEEKEKRFKEFIEHNHKLLKELKDGSEKLDKSKNEKIEELMKNNEKFLKEQKDNTEKFLKEQGFSREEIEKKRDAQIHDMRGMILKFTQLVSGTQQRGAVGETLLCEALQNSIKAGVVKKDLRIGSKSVEFAWDLGDGKYIPIDSKFPDVIESYNEYTEASDEEKKQLKKKIADKLKKCILEIQKYQNQHNTIDNCILVLPAGIIESCPEIIGDGRDCHVFICTYLDVFPIAHVLHEQYSKLKEDGDIGKYRKIVEQLLGILESIMKKTESIDRAVAMLTNANDEIKVDVRKGKNI